MANGGGGPRSRNVRVEALRLAAIVGISLFHTMMPWTAQALCDPQAGCGPIGEALGSDPVMLTVLGVISLMGAWGNHVFFMISGLYLVPSLARRSTQVGYWLSSARGTVRRVLAIAVSVAVVAVFALACDAWVTPLARVHELWQWTLGLEFVWLYAAFAAVAPVLAWLLRRMPARLSDDAGRDGMPFRCDSEKGSFDGAGDGIFEKIRLCVGLRYLSACLSDDEKGGGVRRTDADCVFS